MNVTMRVYQTLELPFETVEEVFKKHLDSFCRGPDTRLNKDGQVESLENYYGSGSWKVVDREPSDLVRTAIHFRELLQERDHKNKQAELKRLMDQTPRKKAKKGKKK